MGPFSGLTAGFGGLLGAPLLADLKARGWEIIRQGDFRADAIRIATMVGEIQDAGLTPFFVACAAQFGDIPVGLDVEAYDAPDPTVTGLEPNFRMSPAQYVTPLNAAASTAKARKLRAWAGMVNTDRVALAWLAEVLRTLDPYYGVSLHPYRTPSASDLLQIKRLCGTRPFIVGEWGRTQGPTKSVWQKLLGGHSHPSDATIAAGIASDFDLWRRAGAMFCCVYQLNDGPACRQHAGMPASWREGFGVRRQDGTWKPVSLRGDG